MVTKPCTVCGDAGWVFLGFQGDFEHPDRARLFGAIDNSPSEYFGSFRLSQSAARASSNATPVRPQGMLAVRSREYGPQA
jgi:hypothetical protein